MGNTPYKTWTLSNIPYKTTRTLGNIRLQDNTDFGQHSPTRQHGFWATFAYKTTRTLGNIRLQDNTDFEQHSPALQDDTDFEQQPLQDDTDIEQRSLQDDMDFEQHSPTKRHGLRTMACTNRRGIRSITSYICLPSKCGLSWISDCMVSTIKIIQAKENVSA